ncbi:MAG: hypothetical protein WDN48_02670 [Pseudolabrys sp.]
MGRHSRRHFHRAVLEAARRTTGWIMPLVAVCFLLYAYFGPSLPPPWTHRGYDISRWSATSLSRWKASSASRSTSRRR